MSHIKVASRYAKALLEMAIEKKALEEVAKDVKSLITLANENRELVLALHSPIIYSDKKFNILSKIYVDKINPITLTFFDIVTRKNRANVLIETAHEFVRQYNLHKGIQVAEVTTTLPLTEDLKKRFVEIVKEISGFDKVELIEKINPEIIGGFILKINDKQLDDSINGKLRNLRLKFAERYFVKMY